LRATSIFLPVFLNCWLRPKSTSFEAQPLWEMPDDYNNGFLCAARETTLMKSDDPPAIRQDCAGNNQGRPRRDCESLLLRAAFP
jgi:hypothetical protein